ncbi:MAG: hypothetical protein QW764_02875 [Desulfurococcaceae archaeon]
MLSYEIKLEPDPDDPDNPLAYKIVLIPRAVKKDNNTPYENKN